MKKPMILKDWDIWYSYSTYFIEETRDLNAIAISLVQSKLCHLVYNSDSLIWWNDGKEVREEEVLLNRIGYEPKAKLTFPQGLNGYALEGAYQAASMRFFELHLFNSLYLETFSYIRGFLGACYMKQGERTIALYPQIKLYHNGIIILSFRVISPGIEYPIDSFIENDVNLFKHNTDSIKVPPEWIQLDTRSIFSQPIKGIWNRCKTWNFVKEIDSLIATNIENVDEQEFSFKVAPLDLNNKKGSATMNLDLLKDIAISSLSHVINHANEGIGFIMKGSGDCKYHIGNYWIGRPSIYILDFVDQPYKSQEVIDKYKNELGKIMARISGSNSQKFSNFLEKNLRVFDDYSVHMNEALTLWVYSKKGLNNDKEYYDPNRGHLIYRNQVLVESVDFLYMCHKRQVERSSLSIISYKSILTERSEILKLDDMIKKVSHFGEINDFYAFANKQFNWTEIRTHAEENLKLRAECINEVRNKNVRMFGWLITILFGLFGSPNFAVNVIKPLWKYVGLWLPNNSELQQLFLVFITGCFVILLLLGVWKTTVGRK